MGKVIGGGKPAGGGNPAVAEVKATPNMASVAQQATNEASSRTMAEELAAKKTARTRGGSRMLLSAARLNAQEGLSAASTLGG